MSDLDRDVLVASLATGLTLGAVLTVLAWAADRYLAARGIGPRTGIPD